MDSKNTASKKLLLINPNSSAHTTFLIKETVRSLPPSSIFEIQLYTAPSGPHSINNAEDGQASTEIVLQDLGTTLQNYDAFLVACYSMHPLVPSIEEKLGSDFKSVIGIFEASISASLALLPSSKQDGSGKFDQFGIVTTGKYFEKELTDGAVAYLSARGSGTESFGGAESTGLDASDLHTINKEIVMSKMKEATRKLVRRKRCGVVCLGCAGMAGMEDIVREAIVEELGDEAKSVHIIDGVKAGVGLLEGLENGEGGS